MTFTDPLPALTTRQRTTFWIVAAVSAASRFLAFSRTLWEWDEALFCLGMRSYDVASHHPHPPGFPVYIALAKIARLFTDSDFHALQTLNLIAGVLLFPAMFMLARELRLRFTTAMIAATLFVFFPNVWFFGGTAFSDVTSIAMVVAAAAFLLRGCRDPQAYVIGSLLLALSVGIRPQNALVGLFPALLSTWHRARQSLRAVALAVLIGGAVVGISYAGAAHFTGFERYVSAVRAHGEYITRVDSFRNPDRPPLWRLIDRFFIKQYQQPALSMITSLFVLASIVGAVRARDRSMLANALMFVPFAISAWLMLDRYSVSRFSIGYQPMFAFFAADGIARIARKPKVEVALGGVLVVAFMIWTLPALRVVREVAPSVLGVDAVRRHLDPKHADLYVAFQMTPFIDLLLPNYPYTLVADERGLPLSDPARPAYRLKEIEHTIPAGYVFERARGPLWDITRRHYFDVALEPLRRTAQFGNGWYGVEREGTEAWRWMGSHSTTLLPAARPRANLRLQLEVPGELVALHATISILLNGVRIDRFTVTEARIEREYDLRTGAGMNTLELTTDQTVKQSGSDGREFALRLRSISWGSEE